MNEEIKPLPEVIIMASKGYIPYKKEKIVFQDNIYEENKSIGKRNGLQYINEDETTEIEIQFDKSGNPEFVLLKESDDEQILDEKLLYDKNWTEKQIQDTFDDLK